jgi:hypothetical protein
LLCVGLGRFGLSPARRDLSLPLLRRGLDLLLAGL